MTAGLEDVFADTSFWIALVVKQDQYHDRAQKWAVRVAGRMTTTAPVLLETANALARPAWRPYGIALIDHVQQRQDVEVLSLSGTLAAWLGSLPRPSRQGLEPHRLSRVSGHGGRRLGGCLDCG